ncbi:hypothetical protein EBJ67_08340 [Salmonella enterica subsp. enterica serovar Bovismorbificans]|nr:hypothetical protein [Salmonella enterica subsp. enterica serovar Bovismorbificans]
MTTNHPAHGPVSLDRLHQISEILSKAAAQSDGGNLGYAMDDAIKVIDWAIETRNAKPAPCPKCNDTGVAEFSHGGESILIECDCRAAMLQAANSPVAPDGWALVPKRLTAENGAKGVLSGEFSETKFINCPECFGDDECETCDGSGRIEITVPVTWTTIKAIWAKGIEHFAAAPQQEVKS